MVVTNAKEISEINLGRVDLLSIVHSCFGGSENVWKLERAVRPHILHVCFSVHLMLMVL